MGTGPLAAGFAALIILAAAGGWFLLAGRSVKTAEPSHLSMVVLPFANLSGDSSQDYFADGITENLTTDLSRLSRSFVIARNTAFTYRGKNVDAKEIGKELGVRYVLEGSVQRDKNQVRVNAQLVDAESGGHLWAERFDKPLANLFSMQDAIVSSLASRLGVELITNEARRAERVSTPDSMDLYFQGMAWLNKGKKPDDIAHARRFFERALTLDPGNLDASLGTVAVDALTAQGYRVDGRSRPRRPQDKVCLARYRPSTHWRPCRKDLRATLRVHGLRFARDGRWPTWRSRLLRERQPSSDLAPAPAHIGQSLPPRDWSRL